MHYQWCNWPRADESLEVSPEMEGCAANSGSFIDCADISSKEMDHLI